MQDLIEKLIKWQYELLVSLYSCDNYFLSSVLFAR